jgi:hypothetical protein
MDENEVRDLLEALDRAGKRVTASKEASVAFLTRIGILDESGEVNPFFRDGVESIPPSWRE